VGGLISGLGEWIATPTGRGERVLAAYRDHQVRYGIGLVFPDGTEQRFDVDFAGYPPRLAEARVGAPEADLVSASPRPPSPAGRSFAASTGPPRAATAPCTGSNATPPTRSLRPRPCPISYILTLWQTREDLRRGTREVEQQLSVPGCQSPTGRASRREGKRAGGFLFVQPVPPTPGRHPSPRHRQRFAFRIPAATVRCRAN
jgi:hypothetical protein